MRDDLAGGSVRHNTLLPDAVSASTGGRPDHRQGRQDRPADSYHANPQSLQTGQALRRTPVAPTHHAPGNKSTLQNNEARSPTKIQKQNVPSIDGDMN